MSLHRQRQTSAELSVDRLEAIIDGVVDVKGLPTLDNTLGDVAESQMWSEK